MKYKNCTFVLVFLLVIPLLFTNCSNNDIESEKNINIQFTITSSTDPGGMYLMSSSCTLENKDVTTNATIKHNSQYSLTYYDNDKNIAYYSSNTDKDRDGGDQLFSFDIETNNHKQLTKNLFALNNIIPIDEDKLFLGAVKTGARIVSPSYYDLSKRKWIDLEWDNDFNLSNAQKDPSSGKIYVSGYLDSEDYTALDQLNSEKIEGSVGIDNQIYQLVDNNHELVFELKKRYIESFAINGKYLICKTYMQGSAGTSDTKIISYNLDSKEKKELDITIPGDIFYIDKSAENIYTNTGTEIMNINTSTKKNTSLYKIDISQGWINNAQWSVHQ